MKRHLLLTLPLTALALAACGQKTTTPPGGQNPSTDKPYTKLGFVSSTSSNGGASVCGGFFSISPAALPQVRDASTLNTCQLGKGPNDLDQALSPVTMLTPGTSLDAGDQLTFKKNGMAFASVPRMNVQLQAVQPNYIYQAGNLVLGGLSNLTLSVPGAAGGFPAFSDVPFAVPNPALSIQTPADRTAVKLDTTFTWTGASNDPAATVFLIVGQNNLEFTCTARDDGSFTIPSDFQDVLRANKFTVGALLAVQVIAHIKASGDALMLTQSSSLICSVN